MGPGPGGREPGPCRRMVWFPWAKEAAGGRSWRGCVRRAGCLRGVVGLTTPGGRLGRILAELSAGGQGWSSARLCGVCPGIAGVTGASIMVMSGEIPGGSLYTSDEVSHLIEELQPGGDRVGQGRDLRAGRRRPGRGLLPAAGPRPQPQPAPDRCRPGRHRRHPRSRGLGPARPSAALLSTRRVPVLAGGPSARHPSAWARGPSGLRGLSPRACLAASAGPGRQFDILRSRPGNLWWWCRRLPGSGRWVMAAGRRGPRAAGKAAAPRPGRPGAAWPAERSGQLTGWPAAAVMPGRRTYGGTGYWCRVAGEASQHPAPGQGQDAGNRVAPDPGGTTSRPDRTLVG
jgi:hypothetical protein